MYTPTTGPCRPCSQIETLELQLQQLQFALTSYLDPDAALKLDTSITGEHPERCGSPSPAATTTAADERHRPS